MAAFGCRWLTPPGLRSGVSRQDCVSGGRCSVAGLAQDGAPLSAGLGRDVPRREGLYQRVFRQLGTIDADGWTQIHGENRKAKLENRALETRMSLCRVSLCEPRRRALEQRGGNASVAPQQRRGGAAPSAQMDTDVSPQRAERGSLHCFKGGASMLSSARMSVAWANRLRVMVVPNHSPFVERLILYQ